MKTIKTYENTINENLCSEKWDYMSITGKLTSNDNILIITKQNKNKKKLSDMFSGS